MLLAAVLGVWGIIGYKIISGVSPTISEVKQENFDKSFNPKVNTEVDTFSIQSLERDPFLGTLSRKQKTSSSSITQSKNSLINAKITYRGLVKKQSTSDKIYVVNINDHQYLLKIGQIADSVQLIKGNEKEIIIRYQNKNQTIKRQ